MMEWIDDSDITHLWDLHRVFRCVPRGIKERVMVVTRLIRMGYADGET